MQSLSVTYSTNKTDRYDIAEVALNTITPTIGNIIKIIVCCIILNKHVSTHQYVHLGEYVHMIHVILSQVPCIYIITWRTTFNGRGNIGYSWIITPSWRKYLTNLLHNVVMSKHKHYLPNKINNKNKQI